MKWLKKVNAKIDLEEDKITILRKGIQIIIPISCKKNITNFKNPAIYMINLLSTKLVNSLETQRNENLTPE